MADQRPTKRLADHFRDFASWSSAKLGSHWAFLSAAGLVLVWLLTGPLFHFSDSWQLVINTGTTVVTFMMVFLIQSTQNRDAQALHLKLDELIRSSKARNIFAGLETASEAELVALTEEFRKLRERGLRSEEATALVFPVAEVAGPPARMAKPGR